MYCFHVEARAFACYDMVNFKQKLSKGREGVDSDDRIRRNRPANSHMQSVRVV